jgi:hypothetical protein
MGSDIDNRSVDLTYVFQVSIQTRMDADEKRVVEDGSSSQKLMHDGVPEGGIFGMFDQIANGVIHG